MSLARILERRSLPVLTWVGAAIVVATVVGFVGTSEHALLFTYLMDLSIIAEGLEGPSAEATMVNTVAWVSRRYSDSPRYDATQHAKPTSWVYGRHASCDQQVALTQRLLFENGIASESWALFGEHDVSRHTVLVVAAGDRRIVLDPYFGWIFHGSSGELASFEEIQQKQFTIRRIAAPDPEVAQPSRAEYARLFAPDHPPAVLGEPLSQVYSWKYRVFRRLAKFCVPIWKLATRESHLGSKQAWTETSF
jgi:hypothetical protein